MQDSNLVVQSSKQEYNQRDQILNRLVVWLLAGIVALAALCRSPEPAWAKPFKSQRTEVQLISEVKTIQPGKPYWVGLQFKTRPGWHTYWRNPGDSGSPTQINWTLPSGFKAGELVYPYPEQMPIGPLMNFGYKSESLLLTKITPPAKLPNQPVMLRAKASWLVCEVECVPEESTFALTLPVTPKASANEFCSSSRCTADSARTGTANCLGLPASVAWIRPSDGVCAVRGGTEPKGLKTRPSLYLT